MNTRDRSRVMAMLLTPLFLVACGESEAGEASGGEPAVESGGEPAVESAPVVSSGTTLTLQLAEAVSTRSHTEGDAVIATVTEDVSVGGDVVVPAGSQMVGVVDDAQRSDGPDTPAVLRFHFETLRVGGDSYPVTATVESAEPRMTEGDSDAESVAKVVIGTAAGAVVGQILGGDKESTLGGAAAGTIAGAAVAITSQHGDATLEQGSLITVQLQEPVRLD